jgi:apolipoprotein N-acyltransferase
MKSKRSKIETPRRNLDSLPDQVQLAWWERTLFLSICGGVLLGLSLPYFAVWPLAYLGLFPFIALIRRRCTEPGFYFYVWVGCYIHWLWACWFATRPHWAGYIGWIFMAGYLSTYYLLFVAICRRLLTRFKSIELLIYPMVWVALEWTRGHAITGYSLASLAHTHYQLPTMIQVADIFGAYTLSFAIVLISASAYLVIFGKRPINRIGCACVALAVFTCVFTYGQYRLNQNLPAQREALRIAIIQGSVDTEFPWTEQLQKKSIDQYRQLTIDARKHHPDLQLIVWPESAFPLSLDRDLPDDQKDDYYDQFKYVYEGLTGAGPLGSFDNEVPFFPTNTPLLTGIATFGSNDATMYNSVVLIDPEGKPEVPYHKCHRVMFGEYIPFGDEFPQLYELAPIPKGILAGTKSKAFSVESYQICPSICFESTVPHFIRNQISQLEREGVTVDLLANISNDGWFWGSNCLDQHLASNVFRSVENRKPTVAAVNTGFSAYIDGNGRILQQGGRRVAEYLYVEAKADGRRPIYRIVGDWPAITIATTVLGMWIFAICFRNAQAGSRN